MKVRQSGGKISAHWCPYTRMQDNVQEWRTIINNQSQWRLLIYLLLHTYRHDRSMAHYISRPGFICGCLRRRFTLPVHAWEFIAFQRVPFVVSASNEHVQMSILIMTKNIKLRNWYIQSTRHYPTLFDMPASFPVLFGILDDNHKVIVSNRYRRVESETPCMTNIERPNNLTESKRHWCQQCSLDSSEVLLNTAV